MSSRNTGPVTRGRWWLVALVLAGVVVVAAALFASGDPDGLERVAGDLGLPDGISNPFEGLAHYTIPGLDGPASTIVAGLVGIGLVFALTWGIGRLLARRNRDRAAR